MMCIGRQILYWLLLVLFVVATAQERSGAFRCVVVQGIGKEGKQWGGLCRSVRWEKPESGRPVFAR